MSFFASDKADFLPWWQQRMQRTIGTVPAQGTTPAPLCHAQPSAGMEGPTRGKSQLQRSGLEKNIAKIHGKQ